MKKHLFLIAGLALGMAACTNDVLTPDDNAENNAPGQEATSSNLKTVKLAVFSGNQSRVTYENATRAESDELQPGELRLIATVANPDKEIFSNSMKSGSTGGRHMSATSIYFDETSKKYYITYHMQGNNYNTTLDNEIAGAIQILTTSEDGSIVDLGDGFSAENRAEIDYDFNHIYFDKYDNRILVVGHDMKGGNQKNTTAIIGQFDPTEGTLAYKSITTAEKKYDENGKSLGEFDAGDANCVIRVFGYPEYFVATRKGLAVLSANQQDLFESARNEDNTKYFIPTPASCKFVFDTPRVGSMFDMLYLSDENESETAFDSKSRVSIAQFQTAPGLNGHYVLINPESPYVTYYDSKDLDITKYPKQFTISQAMASPIDGKNAFWVNEDYEYYAPLGVNGLFYKFRGAKSQKPTEGVMKFGDRPVNCVVMDLNSDDEGLGEGYDRTSHDGFIYVANGSKLTILHRRTMEEVASYNFPYLDENENPTASSANYINVQKLPKGENGLCERIVTVAYGQAGVKVFKFMPTTKTVWEHNLEQ